MRSQLSFILFALLFINLFSQTTGKIKGKVFDSFGNPVSGANITVVGTTWGAESDKDGYYYIIGVRAGIYTLRMQMNGFPDLEKREIKVKVGQTTVQDLKIDVLYPVTNSNENSFLIIPDKNSTQTIILSKDSLNIQDNEGFTPLLGLFYPSYNFLDKWEPDSLFNKVQRLTNFGANVNIQNNYGVTPLMKACELGSINVVELLLKNKADIELKNYLDQTAIFYSVKSGKIKIVDLLIQNKVKTNLKDNTGRKPIFYAKSNHIIDHLAEVSDLSKNEKFLLSIIKNDVAELKEMIKKNININFTFKDNKSALMYACEIGNADIVGLLIDKKIKINVTDNEGKNALLYCSNSDSKIINMLIEAGIELNLQNKRKETALILASKNNNLEVVETLMSKGADETIKDVYNKTALEWAFDQNNQKVIETIVRLSQNDLYKAKITFWAIENNLLNIIQILHDNDFNLNIQNEKKQTPLYKAILYKKYNIAEYLISKNVDINISSDIKMTPLIVAVKYSKNTPLKMNSGNSFISEFNNYQEFSIINNSQVSTPEISIIDVLIKNGAKINIDSLETTPLTAAFEVFNFNLAEKLIALGADLNPENTNLTPLTVLVKTGNLEYAFGFIDKGANINLRNNDGYIPLQFLLTHNRNKSDLIDYVKQFHKKGSDLDNLSKSNASVIMNAVETNNIEVIKYILNFTSTKSLNSIENKGRSVLWYAINNNKSIIVDLLLEHGADINISKKLNNEQKVYNLLSTAIACSDSMSISLINKGINIDDKFYYNEETPLMYACQYKRIETIKKLLSLGADPSEKDKNGKTAFDHARNNKDILEILNSYKKK